MQEIKELVTLICSIIKATDKSLEDGKISFTDIPNFSEVLPKIIPGLLGSTNAITELRNLNKVQYQELASFIKSEFDLKNDATELLIESIFDIIIGFVLAFREFQNG